MKRPLVLVGGNPGRALAIARILSAEVRCPVSEIRATEARQGDPAALDRALATPGVVVVEAPGLLAGRDLRLDLLDRALLVAVQQGRASDTREALGGEVHASVGGMASPAEAAAEALQLWRRDPLMVAAGERSYLVDAGEGIAESAVATLGAGVSRVVVVSDENVFRLHGARLSNALTQSGTHTSSVVLPPGEQHKNLSSVEAIWTACLRAGADRGSLILGFGGGVVTDMAGFAAAAWMRGVPWVGVPTTLLAMVDASVGGKTGVDLLAAKNAVGAFWQPAGVFCDVGYLRTEPARGYRSALAEIVKTALIGDAALLDLLEQAPAAAVGGDPQLLIELVRRSIRVKAGIVSRDEREGGLRAVLNLGHTVGHALESRAGYTELAHGEAVSLGLVVALRLGRRLGITPVDLVERIRYLLTALGLPTETDRGALREAVDRIGHDKKRAGSQIRFVFAEGAGRVGSRLMDLEELRRDLLALE